MTRALIAVALASAIGVNACSRRDNSTTDTSQAAVATPDTTAPAPATQPPEQQFLIKMTDHHEGLILMASGAATKATKSVTKADATKLRTKQTAERDKMVAMLRSTYNDSHTPQAMAKHVAQNDSLQALSGPAYDSTFYRMVIEHHREGIAMIDSMSPQFTKADVKQMADKMKSDQQKEIADFQRKVR